MPYPMSLISPNAFSADCDYSIIPRMVSSTVHAIKQLKTVDSVYIKGLLAFVTVYGKTRHIGFIVKIEFDVSLISSTLELTHLQV